MRQAATHALAFAPPRAHAPVKPTNTHRKLKRSRSGMQRAAFVTCAAEAVTAERPQKKGRRERGREREREGERERAREGDREGERGRGTTYGAYHYL